MNAEWQHLLIGDVCSIVNGGTPKTGVSAYWDGDNAWITPAEMGKRDTPYVETTERTLTDAGLSNSSARLLPPNSVILSSRAPIGYLVINTVPMATNQGCKGLVPSEQIEAKFLFHYLSSVVSLLNSLGTGATFKELSGAKLRDVPVPVPPLQEQRRIVAILDEAFEGITRAVANAARNLANARAVFDSHLDAVFANQHADWVNTTVGAHIDFIDYRGKTPTKTESGLRLITAKNVRMGFLRDQPMEFVHPDSYDSWMTRGIPRKGDVLFTTEAPLGNVAQLDTDEKVAFAQRVIIMQPDPSKLVSGFLKYMLMSPPVQKRILEKGTGATATGIKASLLRLIPISFPTSLDVQAEIAASFDQLEDHVERLETIFQQKLNALDALKKSLLHRAFSGAL